MKWYFLILSFLFVTLNLNAQKTSCQPAECAKICAKVPDCKPADCAKICASNPSCKPAPSCNSKGTAAANASFLAPLDQLAQQAALKEEKTTSKNNKKDCMPNCCKGVKAKEGVKAVKVAKKDDC